MQSIKKIAALLLTAWMVISALAACADPNGAACAQNTPATQKSGEDTRQTTTAEQPVSSEAPETSEASEPVSTEAPATSEASASETDVRTISVSSRQIVSEGAMGRIYLYGEYHAQDDYLEKELELWGMFYAQGMRDLFEELGYCDTALLNLWMQAEDDEILLRFYNNLAGTQAHAQNVLDYYHAIKDNYPETVFHSFDVEHQYDSTGAWYLSMLREAGQEDTEAFRLAQEACDQGKTYYGLLDTNTVEGEAYRENCMTENFIRSYDQNGCVPVMAIAGDGHCDIHGVNYWGGGRVACMANQLNQKYGRTLFAVKDLVESFRSESVMIQLGEQKLQAVNLGVYCPADFGFDYVGMKVYQSEKAFETLRTCAQTNLLVPSQYLALRTCAQTDLLVPLQYLPISAEAQAVIIVDFYGEDRSKERYYFLTGYTKDGEPAMVQILPEE